MKKVVSISLLIVFGCGVIQAQMQERLGNKLFDLGEYQKALDQYMQCLDEHPQNGEVMGRVADSYFQLNQPELASDWYEKAIQKEETPATINLRYGHCLKYLGHYQKAMEQYELYREIYPREANHFLASTKFAIAHRDKGKPANQVRNLPLNTEAPDFGVTLRDDQLIYSSYGNGQRSTGVVRVSNTSRGGKSQLFFIEQNAATNRDMKPAALHTEVERKSNIGPVHYNDDGTLVAFTRNNFRKGERQVDPRNKNLALYLAEPSEDGSWDQSRAFPHNGMGYSTTTPCFSKDGKTLFFASNKEGGAGNFDLYYSEWNGSNWEEAVNMGPSINTPGNEWISSIEGNTLYFSSDWHHGFGGMDLFSATLNGTSVTGIKNLGYGINSPRDDYGYVPDVDHNKAYFTSNRTGSVGFEDIYVQNRSDSREPNSLKTESFSSKSKIPDVDPLQNTAMEPLRSTDKLIQLKPPDTDPVDGKNIEEVFSIQIAVFSDKETEVEQFARQLGDIGDVYKLYFDRLIKIRVGNFSGRSKATEALQQVQHRGYSDAFIVKEQLVRKEKDSGANTSKADGGPHYEIRLATYSDPKWFDPSSVEHLGLISTREKDDWTIVYLGDYQTIEEAEDSRVEAVEAGFNSAQLVRVENGSYSIIR